MQHIGQIRCFFNVRNHKDREAKISQRRHFSLRGPTSFHICVNIKSFPLMPKRLKSCKKAAKKLQKCSELSDIDPWCISLEEESAWFLFSFTQIKSLPLQNHRFTFAIMQALLFNYKTLKLFYLYNVSVGSCASSLGLRVSIWFTQRGYLAEMIIYGYTFSTLNKADKARWDEGEDS